MGADQFFRDSLAAAQKLAAYYVGKGMSLGQAVDKSLDVFNRAWTGVVSNNAALLAPSDMDPQRLRMGLAAIDAALDPASGKPNGIWRNFGAGQVGLWQPDSRGWALAQGKPLLLNLKDVEGLGAIAEGKVANVPSLSPEYPIYLEDQSEAQLVSHPDLQRQALTIIANPRTDNVIKQYQNMWFKPARQEQFRVKGNWAEHMQTQYPQVYARIVSVAEEMGVPAAIALRVAYQESGGNPQVADGDNGRAAGVYQLHEGAAADMNLSPEERRDLDKNIRAGIGYLKARYRQFGSWEKALMGYNGGPGVAWDNPQARAYAAKALAGVEGRY
jgi:aromatic ring-cleaving dioxygenase